MNFISENRAVVLAGGAAAILLLLILIILLRNKSKKGKTRAESLSTNSMQAPELTRDSNGTTLPTDLPIDLPTGLPTGLSNEATDANPFIPTDPHSDSRQFDKSGENFSHQSSQIDFQPEFIELFVVEDPLDGSGYLGTQINRESSYISDFEIRAFINKYENELLSQESLKSGFAQKSAVAGKIRTVLFGEVEAIAKSTASFHPEIEERIERANIASIDFRLLAIDGLVYGVFQIGRKSEIDPTLRN